MAKMASGDLSLTSTSSQEEESSEYVGYDSTLRPPSNSSGSTTAANMANNNGPTKGANTTNIGANTVVGGVNVGGGGGVGKSKKYDLLQSQYESAVLDLNTLRHQHSDSERRCVDLATQLTLYQEHYVADRSKFKDMVAENGRLKQENELLEHKLILLENQNGNAPPPQPPQSNSGYYFKPCDGSCTDKLAELKKERNLMAVEREKYKKSFIELEKERSFYRERADDNQTLKVLLSKETKNVVSLTEELNQLLSEKDNVLQEHQKMSDDLALANKEIERLKKDDLMYKSEMKSLQLANAELKKRDLLKSRESSWSKEFADSGKELEATKELEKLRKSLEKAQSEVERAGQDADEAKRVRDWAISQREKIVQERDSVKTLCDNLRKERDKAISEQLLAIRDSEKIKKQKDEAQKKIDALKEQLLESQNLDNASRRSFRMSSYEAEELLEIELCNYHDSDLGIILDDSNKRLLVCGVTNSSPAFGKLKINDVICKVNNIACSALSKRMVLDEIRACAPRGCQLLVSRTRHSKRHCYTVQLRHDNHGMVAHGLQLDMGVFVAKIEPNSLASCQPELDVGDRVLSINNKSMDTVQSIDEVMQLLSEPTITIFALKYVQDQLGGPGGGSSNYMTSSSAQTDSIDSMQHVSATSGGNTTGGGGGTNSGQSKHPSKFADFFLRKLSKFSKPGGIGGVGGGMGDDNFEQEHDDAIAALDSVLSENSSEKSKENLFKRNKRGKKEKEAAAKSMGTWPRTNITISPHDNPTGTIVQRSVKKRAPMSLFNAGPINVDKDDDVGDELLEKAMPAMAMSMSMSMPQPQASSTLLSSSSSPPPPLPSQLSKPLALAQAHIRSGGNGSAIKTHPNRNSNPVSPTASALFQATQSSYPRHSLYAGGGVGGLPPPVPPPTQPLPPHLARVKLPANDHRYPAMGSAAISSSSAAAAAAGATSSSSQGGGSNRSNNRISLNFTPSGDFYHLKTTGQQAQQQAAGSKQQSSSTIPTAYDMFHQSMGGGPGGGGGARNTQLFMPLHPPPRANATNNNSNNTNNTAVDVVSLKSQNSIESMLSAKSPPPISEYGVYPTSSKLQHHQQQQQQQHHRMAAMPMPQAVRHVPKYPSDSESIGSTTISSGGGGGGALYAPGNRHTQLFPSFPPPSGHGLRYIRRSSPLTLPSPPPPPTTNTTTTTQLLPTSSSNGPPHSSSNTSGSVGAGGGESARIPNELDYLLNHQSQSQSHYNDHYGGHHGVIPYIPLSSSSSGGGGNSVTAAQRIIYEGGTFPRKKDNQRLRIPSNPSVAGSKSSNMTSGLVKNSSGSISDHHQQHQQQQQHQQLQHHHQQLQQHQQHQHHQHQQQQQQHQQQQQQQHYPMLPPQSMMSSTPSPLIHPNYGGTLIHPSHHHIHHGGGGGNGGSNSGIMINSVSGTGGGGGGSGRGSPMPQVHVEVLSHGGSKRNANISTDFLCPGDLRRVTIDKSESLGITIQCNNNGGGIFVSTVADKSTAMRAGLQVGDQLLEVCGINMRAATNDIAANVLRQCGDSITMLVQYNPEKFHSTDYEGTSSHHHLEPESPVNHSGSPTPRNSPRPPARNVLSSLPPPLALALATTAKAPSSSIKDQSFTDSLENQSDIGSSQDNMGSNVGVGSSVGGAGGGGGSASTTTATTTTTNNTNNSTNNSSIASTTSNVYEETKSPVTNTNTDTLRYVTLHMDKSKNLGIKLFGGNKVGIYVYDVASGSPSDHAGIRKGDQILEYNGVDLSGVTAEQAANEISKLTDTVTMLVQNKLQTLKQIKDTPGDSFYIRVGFDRNGELNEDDLRFVKDEVLYVDNTVFNGTFGLWRAWKLDAMGHRKECGIIPSQMKMEEELRSGETVDCDTGNARRGSTSARRSFFRRKKNQRSSSRDSTEIASFSNTQLSFFPDSGILNDDGGVLSYQRVELLDSPIRRPVLIIGPLSDCVMGRLKIDFSHLFKLCEVTTMDCSQDVMEEGLKENIFVDYRRRGNKFECTTVEAISNACKNDRRHCILDVSISAVERLQRLQIYPIVLLLRFKSAKQIRDIRDFGNDKISAKAAKEMVERALKLEFDYKQYISAVIPGVSIKHMCTQIKDAVDKEQAKLLWVPVSI